ncbi:hypothetical protein BC832DRAFT_427351 [Gaertneriomyces semiglobifer]|nr:hypothetical protein BC832DRAFT_427351 [Gaertneriomyces semiglobifer]
MRKRKHECDRLRFPFVPYFSICTFLLFPVHSECNLFIGSLHIRRCIPTNLRSLSFCTTFSKLPLPYVRPALLPPISGLLCSFMLFKVSIQSLTSKIL